METINQKVCMKIIKEALVKLTAGELDLSEVVGLIEEFFDGNTVILSESEMYCLLQNIIEDKYWALHEKYEELNVPDYLDDIINIIGLDEYVNDRLDIEAMRNELYRDYFDETECMMICVEGEYYYIMFKEMM